MKNEDVDEIQAEYKRRRLSSWLGSIATLLVFFSGFFLLRYVPLPREWAEFRSVGFLGLLALLQANSHFIGNA